MTPNDSQPSAQHSLNHEGFEQICVIGAGPAGIRFAQEVLKRHPHARLTIFGNEPGRPYNRVQLSALLANDISEDDIYTELPNPDEHPNFRYEVRHIRKIDTHSNTITDQFGEQFFYDKLVLATGSRPHLPNIPGIDQQGVYTFRNIKDTEYLYTRKTRSRHIIVLGGGLLGLEAARALRYYQTEVTLVQQGTHLMNRQLDAGAAALLEAEVKRLGIKVITGEGVREIFGDGRVTGVRLRGGETIDCDTVLICAGIKANLEIAREAKIKVGKGISVNDRLETSAPNVYAIGECCEHRGLTYGLVNPGFEQAAIAAANICGKTAQYLGSLEVSRLKVLGQDVISMGDVSDQERRPFVRNLYFKNKKRKIYRKVTLHKGQIVGALAYGEWPESRRLQDAFQQGQKIWPWQQLAFFFSGYFWGKGSANDPLLWPSSAVICQCKNITQGEICQAIATQCESQAEIAKCTGAGTVCGSCKPLISAMLKSDEAPERESAWLPALLASFSAIFLLALFILIPESKPSDSVQSIGFYESIWADKFWKQVSGFSLLGLSAIGLLMSLRKRLKTTKLGKFAYWRLLHIVLGLLCAATLFMHTGAHLGSNLNRWLMLNFLAVLSLGAVAGTIFSLSHTFKQSLSYRLKRQLAWTHILVSWPLPILLGAHIVSVYYF